MSKHLHTHYKFLATAATAALVVSATAPIASAEAIQFKDVSERYQEAIQFLVSTGAKGTSPSTFSTYDHIKRVDAAIMLSNVLKLDIKNAPNSGFKDVPERAKGAVNALKQAGITSGKAADKTSLPAVNWRSGFKRASG